jgi:predicted DNA-binding transcriptional regulator AlpA
MPSKEKTMKKNSKQGREKAIDAELGFEGPLLSRSDVKEMLKISRSSLDRWIKSNYFPPPDYMLGGTLARWKKETITKWLIEQVGK